MTIVWAVLILFAAGMLAGELWWAGARAEAMEDEPTNE